MPFDITIVDVDEAKKKQENKYIKARSIHFILTYILFNAIGQWTNTKLEKKGKVKCHKKTLWHTKIAMSMAPLALFDCLRIIIQLL